MYRSVTSIQQKIQYQQIQDSLEAMERDNKVHIKSTMHNKTSKDHDNDSKEFGHLKEITDDESTSTGKMIDASDNRLFSFMDTIKTTKVPKLKEQLLDGTITEKEYVQEIDRTFELSQLSKVN